MRTSRFLFTGEDQTKARVGDRNNQPCGQHCGTTDKSAACDDSSQSGLCLVPVSAASLPVYLPAQNLGKVNRIWP